MTQLSSTAFSTAHPLTFTRGRNGDVYGVNGEGRGFRWDGSSASLELLGITAPAGAPTVTSSASSPKYYLSAINVTDGGFGYETVPDVTISGSGGAQAKAELLNGRVHRIVMQDYGAGYTAAPTVTIGAPDGGGGAGSAATLAVTASGSIADILPTNLGSGYTSAPTITVSGGTPTTPALLRAVINDDGQVDAVEILNPGAGYTATPTISFSGGGGSGAAGQVVMSYRVTAVAPVSPNFGGAGWAASAKIRFYGAEGGGAYAEPVIDTSGSVTSVTVRAGGSYREPPLAEVVDAPREQPRLAHATPVVQPAIKGKYWCAIRYVDDTSPDPIPSSISSLTEVEVTAAAGSLSWSWSNTGMEDRVDKIELWRSTSDQALVLYRVAILAKTATTYTDTVGDSELIDPSRTVTGVSMFSALPIVLPNGQVNARRFNPPPQNKRVVVTFQDRAWYAVDVPGRTFDYTLDADHSEPNSLYFSEVDEPESVPETNELVIQTNVKGQDRISALMPFGGGMVVFQTMHAYRLAYAAQPVIDASVELIAQRGCLNQRCWDVHDGVAYVADSSGMYSLAGSQVTPLSDPVRRFWSDGLIDFSQSKWFHVRVDPVTNIVRFFYAASAGFPDRALCFRPSTSAWWSEIYAQTFASADCIQRAGQRRLLAGGQSGALLLFDTGSQDLNAAGSGVDIPCYLRTGNMALANEPDRHIRVLYKPTTADCQLSLALHYNNSATPRQAAVQTNRGSGFVTDAGNAATLNMALARSPLGDATGYALCHYAGRVDDRSAGADRHLALAISTTRPSAETAIVYGLAVAGVS